MLSKQKRSVCMHSCSNGFAVLQDIFFAHYKGNHIILFCDEEYNTNYVIQENFARRSQKLDHLWLSSLNNPKYWVLQCAM